MTTDEAIEAVEEAVDKVIGDRRALVHRAVAIIYGTIIDERWHYWYADLLIEANKKAYNGLMTEFALMPIRGATYTVHGVNYLPDSLIALYVVRAVFHGNCTDKVYPVLPAFLGGGLGTRKLLYAT